MNNSERLDNIRSIKFKAETLNEVQANHSDELRKAISRHDPNDPTTTFALSHEAKRLNDLFSGVNYIIHDLLEEIENEVDNIRL